MSRIDDELRELLRDRAEHVVPPANPMSGIERRARAIGRRRKAATVAGSALSVLVIAVVVPATVHRIQGGRQDRGDSAAQSSLVPAVGGPAPEAARKAAKDAPASGGAAAPAPESAAGAAAASTPESATESAAGAAPAPAADVWPANYLDWPTRGETPPRSLVTGIRADFASSLRLRPAEVVTHTLWAGRMSDSAEWLYVFQGWPAGDREAKLAVYRARPGGDSPEAIYRYPIYFQHAGPREDLLAARTDMDRVAVVSIAVDATWALVVGAPGVVGIGYAPPDSGTFRTQAVDDGVALIRRSVTRRVTRELIQATDSNGAVLTPPDLAAQRRAQADRRPVLPGWGMD